MSEEIRAENLQGKVDQRAAMYIRRCRIKAYAAALVGEPRDAEFFMCCVRCAEGTNTEAARAQRDLLREPFNSW